MSCKCQLKINNFFVGLIVKIKSIMHKNTFKISKQIPLEVILY